MVFVGKTGGLGTNPLFRVGTTGIPAGLAANGPGQRTLRAGLRDREPHHSRRPPGRRTHRRVPSTAGRRTLRRGRAGRRSRARRRATDRGARTQAPPPKRVRAPPSVAAGRWTSPLGYGDPWLTHEVAALYLLVQSCTAGSVAEAPCPSRCRAGRQVRRPEGGRPRAGRASAAQFAVSADLLHVAPRDREALRPPTRRGGSPAPVHRCFPAGDGGDTCRLARH